MGGLEAAIQQGGRVVYLVMKAHYKEKVGPNILVVEINSEVLDQLNRAKAWIEGDHSRA